MACPERPVTTLTVSLVFLLALFGSYCQMAPVVAGATRGWNLGTGVKYKLTTTLLFGEVSPSKFSGDVGFRLTGELVASAVWQSPEDSDNILLQIELLSPQLWIKSRRAPEPEGFVEHSSSIDAAVEKPVLLLWRNGEVRSVYMDSSETVSSANLKRGLVSLFQYQVFDGQVQERDASGVCNVTYHSVGPRTVEKRKTFCKHNSLPPSRQHPNHLLGVKLDSYRNSTYELTQYLLPSFVRDEERHRMSLSINSEIGTLVVSEREVEIIPGSFDAKTIGAASLSHAIASAHPGFRETSIELEVEPVTCPDNRCATMEQVIDENRNALDNNALGTAKSASVFLKLLPLVKSASPEELLKLLKSPRYRQVKTQLLDIIGSASTLSGHHAAMKILRQDEIGDDTERYLWALSSSPTPNPDVVRDILKRSEETIPNDKVSETLASTAAAMARHYGSASLIEKVRVSLELGLESCTGEECKLKFLRALRNLRSKAAIPTLLSCATDENKAISVNAWRALAALPRKFITPEVKRTAVKVFYQIGAKRDSSARALALNIILESDPTKEELQQLSEYLAGNDPAYEIKKYLTQRMEQLAEKNPRFAIDLDETLTAAGKRIVNYNVLSQRGLSTAFSRSFLKSADSNGSLVTVQEVNSGLLKRGVVDVLLEIDQKEEAVFSLGLFAGGMGSFVLSSDQDQSQVDDEPATTGMEIDFLGVGIRPFVFFSGNGELMGHIWSGTASERTPAFQALASIHNYNEHVPLASGFVAEIDVLGAVSVDLAGQIQLSLWSRNAQSLVDLKAGVAIQGGTKVRSDFVQSMAEYSMTIEPKLELSTDVDFSGPVSLCMRLSQPESLVKYQVYKVERIAGSRHRLRKTRRMRFYNPGRSYLLNRKNNEMCSKIFS